MSSLRVRDAETLARQLDATISKTCDYAIRFQNQDHDYRRKRSNDNAADNSSSSSRHLDLASLDLQLDAMLQRLSLETLLGQGLAVVKQLSEAKKLLQRKHWPGSQRLMMMILLAQAEIEIVSCGGLVHVNWQWFLLHQIIDFTNMCRISFLFHFFYPWW